MNKEKKIDSEMEQAHRMLKGIISKSYVYDDKDDEELQEVKNRIRKWDNLNIFQKIVRREVKPSYIDYRIVNKWLQDDALEVDDEN